MFDLAAQVLTWQAARRTVLLARVVSATGMGSTEPADAMVFADGDRAGRLLSGAVDAAVDEAVRAAVQEGRTSQVLDLVVGDREAHAAGLTCGGHARVLLQPADDVPEEAWNRLAERAPVVLLTDLDEAHLGRTRVLDQGADDDPAAASPDVAGVLRRGSSEAAVVDVDGRALLLAPLWPTPRLVVVGDGHIADALDATARLMGWEPTTVDEQTAGEDAVARLGPGDGVIVLSHDPVLAPSVLQAALAGRAGYVAALGSRHTQALRAQWLTEHDVSAEDQARIHGPAGLDIGARTPQEIAIAVVGEMVAVRAGAPGGVLSRRDGPIHRGPVATG